MPTQTGTVFLYFSIMLMAALIGSFSKTERFAAIVPATLAVIVSAGISAFYWALFPPGALSAARLETFISLHGAEKEFILWLQYVGFRAALCALIGALFFHYKENRGLEPENRKTNVISAFTVSSLGVAVALYGYNFYTERNLVQKLEMRKKWAEDSHKFLKKLHEDARRREEDNKRAARDFQARERTRRVEGLERSPLESMNLQQLKELHKQLPTICKTPPCE